MRRPTWLGTVVRGPTRVCAKPRGARGRVRRATDEFASAHPENPPRMFVPGSRRDAAGVCAPVHCARHFVSGRLRPVAGARCRCHGGGPPKSTTRRRPPRRLYALLCVVPLRPRDDTLRAFCQMHAGYAVPGCRGRRRVSGSSGSASSSAQCVGDRAPNAPYVCYECALRDVRSWGRGDERCARRCARRRGRDRPAAKLTRFKVFARGQKRRGTAVSIRGHVLAKRHVCRGRDGRRTSDMVCFASENA